MNKKKCDQCDTKRKIFKSYVNNTAGMYCMHCIFIWDVHVDLEVDGKRERKNFPSLGAV